MTIALPCPSCDRMLTAPPHFAGRVLACPNCKQPVTVPCATPPAPRVSATTVAPLPPAAIEESEPDFPRASGGGRMTRYTPRRSSNSALIAAAVVFALLLACGVGGFFLYQAASTQRPLDDAAAEKQRGEKTSGLAGNREAESAPRPDAGRAAPTRRIDPARVKAAEEQKWRGDVMQEINAARVAKRVGEPFRAPGMTAAEYQKAVVQVARFKKQYPIEGPMPSYRLLLNADLSPAAAVLPETSKVLRREAFTQIAQFERPTMERLVMSFSSNHPDLRELLEGDVYARLHATPSWDVRKAHYAQFQALTGVKGGWSLLHPFDDLTGPEMKDALAGAEKLKGSGLRALTPGERRVLLAAGAADAVEDAFNAK